jgi:acetyl-CoA carboxylase carboxyltransferase component
MGPEGVISILYKTQLEEAEDPQKLREKLIHEYEEKYLNPYIGAANGFIDDVIDPRSTRDVLSRAFKLLSTKKDSIPQKKHGNIPL